MAITHSLKRRASFGTHHENLNKGRLYCQRRRCSAMTLDSGNVRFMRIFAGVPWKGGVIQQWCHRKRVFRGFGRYVFGTLGNKANVIIQYYLLPSCLSTDPKIRDLEWLCMAWKAILRYMFTGTDSLFVTYLLSDCRLFITRVTNTCDQRKSAGSGV